jgi:Phosphotransferase enzyme family
MDNNLEAVLQQLITATQSHDNAITGHRPLIHIRRPSSEVIKVELRRPNSEPTHVVVKLFKPRRVSADAIKILKEKVRNDFEVTRRFFEAFKNYADYSTAEPIMCLPEMLAMVMKESRGRNLRDLIAKNARLFPSQATVHKLVTQSYRCGEWLRIFQGLTAKSIQDRLNLTDLIEDIDRRLRRLEDGEWLSRGCRSRILRYLEKQAKLVEESDLGLCGIHADFSPSNVLINGNEVIVLDFTMYRIGSVYHDLTYFHRYFENFLHKPIFRRGIITALQDSFLNGYGKTVSPASPIFRLFRMRHVICHLVGIVEPSRSALHERLFSKRVARRYRKWLAEVTRETARNDLLLVSDR